MISVLPNVLDPRRAHCFGGRVPIGYEAFSRSRFAAWRLLPRYPASEGHASRNITPALWLSSDAYYNVGGETSVDGVAQGDAAGTLRLGAGMSVSLWAGGDLILNYDPVVAMPIGEPDAQTVRMTLRQLW